jgi:phosphonate transport system substrate-binding protein
MLAFSVMACDTTTTATTATTAPIVFATEEYPFLLNVQFVPSTSVNAEMTTKLVRLESLLEEELYSRGYVVNVNISVGTSYATVIEAMASEQVHVGFLTAQQYAFTTLEYPGEVEVLLTSVRDAYKAQLNTSNELITDPATIIANANAAGYDGTTESAVKVSSYYSMLLVRDEDYAAFQSEGISWLAGKNVGTQSITSGSGYVYPSFLLSQNDLVFVPNAEVPDEAAGEVGFTTISGHQSAVVSLLNNEVDAVFTFFDARYNTTGAYDTWQAANPGVNIFEVTRVAALTTGIYNDTISGISSLSDGLKAALQQSFIDVIATEEGLAALSIYNHKGYLVAEDSDYDGERALYQFLHPAD